MVVLAVDAHKRSHTVVVADNNGRQLDMKTAPANAAGHGALLTWSKQFPDRKWAIEDCRSFSRKLENDLLSAGEVGVRVPPKLMALHRRSSRTRGKSDPIDALAVARAALREDNLPVIKLDGPDRELRLLTDHRNDLVAERTRVQNRLHLHFHELDAELIIAGGSLDRAVTITKLHNIVEPLTGVVADIARDLLDDCARLNNRIANLTTEITKRSQERTPNLLALFGCGSLGAATLIGEVADVTRFKSKDAFAMFNGTAPVPVWSANKDHFRLNRGGNRQVNAVIHRIAITQLRSHEPAQLYVQNKISHGSTKRDAIRALKRKISNEVYKRLLADAKTLKDLQQDQPSTPNPRAA